MANQRDIQHRIKSVGNTAQITKAMQLVASAKMRRAQDQALAGRNYIASLAYVFSHLRQSLTDDSHPYLRPGKGSKELILVISTDKGLCGALNTNLYKELKEHVSDKTEYVVIGKKLAQVLLKTHHDQVLAQFDLKDPFSMVDLKPVLLFIRERYNSGEYEKVSVAYSRFINTLVQHPTVQQIIPIQKEQLDAWEILGNTEKVKNEREDPDFILEPSPQSLLQTILPLFLSYDVLQYVLESRASEHSSRMVSMKAATENAQDLIKDLTLAYNKARQAAITAELTEIASAMKAMD